MLRLNHLAVESASEPSGRHCAGRKIGVDANRPTDPRTGAIQPQVADPELIASTGAGWVRLNFVLAPWSSPTDRTLRYRRTWAETYGRIISDFVERGLRIYGLIGVEAMPCGPGDHFRTAPQGPSAGDSWLAQYVEQFCTIVEMLHEQVQVFESFNEPDDWHGQKRNWMHPAWFAILLQEVYASRCCPAWWGGIRWNRKFDRHCGASPSCRSWAAWS